MLEVEVKAPCRELEKKLDELGALKVKVENQEDVYFNPSWRDFRESDEALRVRRVDGRYLLTYKGPRIDSETKTREEIEIPTKQGMMEILDKLGFKKAGVVRKTRRVFKLQKFIVCLNRVEGLGDFIEIEARDYREKNRLFKILEKLGIDRKNSTTKSYLELLEGR